jgi:hypothetical protein
LEFVEKVTTPGSTQYVPVSERIVTFDNDGTLWGEQPMYFQWYFVMDRVKAMASKHPEWEITEPFASVLRGEVAKALAGGEEALMPLLMATHTV